MLSMINFWSWFLHISARNLLYHLTGTCTSYHSKTLQQYCFTNEARIATDHTHRPCLLNEESMWWYASLNPGWFCQFWEREKLEQRFINRYLHELSINEGLRPSKASLCASATAPIEALVTIHQQLKLPSFKLKTCSISGDVPFRNLT